MGTPPKLYDVYAPAKGVGAVSWRNILVSSLDSATVRWCLRTAPGIYFVPVASVRGGNSSECAKGTFTEARRCLSRTPQPMVFRCLVVHPLGVEPRDPFICHPTTSGCHAGSSGSYNRIALANGRELGFTRP